MSWILYNIDIDINCNITRERSVFSSKAGSRNSSVFSSTSSVSYHKYIELNNDLLEDVIQNLIDSSQLSYKKQVDASKSVRKATC